MFFSKSKKLLREVERLKRDVRELEDTVRGLSILITHTAAMDTAVAKDKTRPLPELAPGERIPTLCSNLEHGPFLCQNIEHHGGTTR